MENDTTSEDISIARASFLLSLSLFGILGNILSIFVFKFLLHKKFHWYLLLQAVADSIILIKFSIDYMFQLIQLIFYPGYEQNFDDLCLVICFSSNFIIFSLESLTVYLTLIASFDRYMSMRKPYKRFSGNLVTYRYPILISTICFFAILAINSPDFIVNLFKNPYKFIKFDKNEVILTGYKCYNRRLLDSGKTVQNYYSFIVIPTLMIIGPSLGIIIFNLLLWRNIHVYSRISRDINYLNNQCLREEKNKYLFSTPLSLAVLSSRSRPTDTPKDVYHFVMLMMGLSDLPWNFYYLYLNIGMLFYTKDVYDKKLNFFFETFFICGHSVNILIYLVFQPSFRHTASKIINKVLTNLIQSVV